jgi:hypothetical protein
LISISSRHILTLTSSSRSLWYISLLMIGNKLFLLIIEHHLIYYLIVGYLFNQWSCCLLDIWLAFYKICWDKTCLLLSTLLTWSGSI